MTVEVGQSVQFTNKSYVPPGTKWKWDFGDGKTSELKEPTHKYEEAKTYTAILTAEIPNIGPKTSQKLTIEVRKLKKPEQPPKSKIYIGQEFQFKNYNPELEGATYEWDFGDDSPTSGEFEPKKFYSEPKTYTVTYKSTVGGITQRAVGSYIILPITPKASPDALTVKTGKEIQFQNDTEGPPGMKWLWAFGDGTTSTNKAPKHTYTKDGDFSVNLTVTALNIKPLYLKPPLQIKVTPEYVTPSIGSITIKGPSEIGADGNYTAKIIVEATGTYKTLQLKVDGVPISGITPSSPQSMGKAKGGKHTFEIKVPKPPTSVTQAPVAEKLEVTAEIFPNDPDDNKTATGYAKTETLNITLIPQKPAWLLYVYILAGCILLAIIITLAVLAKRPVIPGAITLNGAEHFLTSSPLGPKKGTLEIDLGNLDSDYDGFVMTVSAEKRSNSTQLRINSAINSKNGTEGEVTANREYFDFGRGFPCVEVMNIEWSSEERGRLSLIYDTHQSDAYDYGDDQDGETYD